jgi:hypothetical protein
LGGTGKIFNVLRVTGPIAYSKGIIELIISSIKQISVDSPVREFLLENEIGLQGMSKPQHITTIYTVIVHTQEKNH